MTKNLGVEVRPSLLGDSAGNGLFLGEKRKKALKGEVICEYTGTVLTTIEATRLKDKSYLMRLGSQVYIDAKDHPEVLGRYINDCRQTFGYNVIFKKLPEERKALVIALRDIEPGEELYVDYGRWFWLGHVHTTIGKKKEKQGLLSKLSLKDMVQAQIRREQLQSVGIPVDR